MGRGEQNHLSKAAILVLHQRPRHDVALVRQLGDVRLRET